MDQILGRMADQSRGLKRPANEQEPGNEEKIRRWPTLEELLQFPYFWSPDDIVQYINETHTELFPTFGHGSKIDAFNEGSDGIRQAPTGPHNAPQGLRHRMGSGFPTTEMGRECASKGTDGSRQGTTQRNILHNWKNVLVAENRNLYDNSFYFSCEINGRKRRWEDKQTVKVSQLLRLIRNKYAHRKQEPRIFESTLYEKCKKTRKTNFRDQTKFVQFWIRLFPKLLPGIWAVQEDKTDLFIWSALQDSSSQSPKKTKSNQSQPARTKTQKCPDIKKFPDINDQFVDMMIKALDLELNKGKVERHKFTFKESKPILDVIEIDPHLYSLRSGMKTTFSIDKKGKEKVVKFEVTNRQNQKLYYSLTKMPENRVTIIFGLCPTTLNKTERSHRIVQLIPAYSKLSEYLSPKPVSWKDLSSATRASVKQDYKFIIRHNSQRREYCFNDLDNDILKKLRAPQLNTILENSQQPITVFKKLLQSERTINGSSRWLDVGDFSGAEANTNYLIVNVRNGNINTEDPGDIKNILKTVGNSIVPAEKVEDQLKCWKMKEWKEMRKKFKESPNYTSMNIKFWAVKKVPSYSKALEYVQKSVPSESNVNHIQLMYYDRQNGNKKLRILRRDYDFLFKIDSRSVQIISGVAGIGKTTLLKTFYNNFAELAENAELAEKFKNTGASIPVYATANDFIHYFKAIRRDDDIREQIKYAVSSIVSTNKFEKHLALHIFKNRDLQTSFTLLLDAIDEVPNKYKDIMKKLLKACKTVDQLRVIATCRTYYLTEVSDMCVTNELKHLTWKDNYTIMTEKWKELGKNLEEKDRNTSVIDAKNVLKRYRHHKGLLYKKKFQYTPLFIEMIASLHKKRNDKFHLTLAKVYGKFVRQNFKVYADNKIKIQNKTNLHADVRSQYLEAHTDLALKQINAEELIDFHVTTKLTPGQGLLNNMDPPRFIHLTFAEYFVDLWVSAVLTGKRKRNCSKKVFKKILKGRYDAAKAATKSNNISTNFLPQMLRGKRIKYVNFDDTTKNLVKALKRLKKQ